jgi:hypothetical protein
MSVWLVGGIGVCMVALPVTLLLGVAFSLPAAQCPECDAPLRRARDRRCPQCQARTAGSVRADAPEAPRAPHAPATAGSRVARAAPRLG